MFAATKLCNKRKQLSHNVEKNNKGILHYPTTKWERLEEEGIASVIVSVSQASHGAE